MQEKVKMEGEREKDISVLLTVICKLKNGHQITQKKAYVSAMQTWKNHMAEDSTRESTQIITHTYLSIYQHQTDERSISNLHDLGDIYLMTLDR